VRLQDLITDRKAGKAVLSVPNQSLALAPAVVRSPKSLIAVVAVDAKGENGRLLVFPVSDLPEMPKGKGNKLFNIPSAAAAARKEVLVGVAAVEPNGSLKIYTGGTDSDRHMSLSWADLKEYLGARAQRGAVLPRGWRQVTRLEAVAS